jgi:hypothetical protein
MKMAVIRALPLLKPAASAMSRGEEMAKQWQFTIRGLLLCTAASAVFLSFVRNVSIAVLGEVALMVAAFVILFAVGGAVG